MTGNQFDKFDSHLLTPGVEATSLGSPGDEPLAYSRSSPENGRIFFLAILFFFIGYVNHYLRKIVFQRFKTNSICLDDFFCVLSTVSIDSIRWFWPYLSPLVTGIVS